MSQNRNSISKQILAWAAVFALVLTIIPYSVADQSSNEYFESWSYELGDTDGDNQNDIIFFTFDPDTNVTDYVNIYVEMRVTDGDGNWVGDDDEHYEIYWTENDTFEMEWFVNDCDDYDSDCEGPFDFEFRLYEEIQDEVYYYEDNFTESNISLYETTIVPEGVIQVENGVLADDNDGLNNDISFFAHMEDYDVSNVSIELERKVGTQWVDVGTQETDDGETSFKNMTAGEYRWFAEYDDEDIDEGHTFVFYSSTSDENLGHVGSVEDWDDDDEFDDFAFARWSNGSDESINDGVYVELFYEDNNTLYDESGGNGDGFVVLFYDVEEGNYTFNLYNDTSSGDLMQTGWLHSYGSLNTNHDEWFEDWDYETSDENDNGIDDVITIEYNPDTTCNCTVDIYVEMKIYNDNGSLVHWDEYEHEINGTAEVWFETDEWSPEEEGNYTFEFYLYSEGLEAEDSFNFSAYLECGGGSYYCDSDEWFDAWDYETYDEDGNGEADTIEIGYNPDTDCNCEMNVSVQMYVFDEDNNYVYYNYFSHEINGTEEDWFETNPWSPYEEGEYTFEFRLYDGNWNWEDEFNFTTYLECNAESNSSYCFYDVWFEDWDYETYDENDNDEADTIIVSYNPDTDCNCEMNVSVYMSIFKEDGYLAGYHYYNHEIYGTEEDWFETEDWSPKEDGNYTFNFQLYGENTNGGDSFNFTTYLECLDNCGNSNDEWFQDVWQNTHDDDEDGWDDTFEVEFNPDTTCNCSINVTSVLSVFDNNTKIDEITDSGAIYSDEYDYFFMDWTPDYNGTFDFILNLYDEDNYFEDSRQFVDIELHVRSEAGEEAWFEDEYYEVDNDRFEVNYFPATGCDCWVKVWIYIDVYYDGDKVDTISEEMYIHGDEEKWSHQEWYANNEGYYDFHVVMFDDEGNGPNEIQDHYWIEEIYLGSESNETHNAWFDDISYSLEDRDSDNREDSVSVNYAIATDSSDEMDLLLILDIFDESGEMIGTFEEFFTLPANEMMDISFHWSNTYEEGNVTFDSVLEHLVDGDTDGEIRVQDEDYEIFYLATANEEPEFFIEDVTGRENVFEGQNIELEVLLEGSNDVVVDWYMGDGMTYQNAFKIYHTYEHSGNYEIVVHVYDDDNSVEESFEIYVKNIPPIIVGIMLDEEINEGEEWTPNIQYQDVDMDMDNITVKWILPDTILQGAFVKHTFVDDGEFLISIEVTDDDGGSTVEQRMVTVKNVAPIFVVFNVPSKGEQGVAMDFSVYATDPGDDTITYTFNFGDGTTPYESKTGNASHKFASGDTFMVIICANDEDGGENCRDPIPVSVDLLEQLEESGLPGFGFLGVISALGAITLLRRRTH